MVAAGGWFRHEHVSGIGRSTPGDSARNRTRLSLVTGQLVSERPVSGRFLIHTTGRRNLPAILATLSVAGKRAHILVAVVVWFGLYDVAASTKHSSPVEWFLHFVMQRSVAAHAPELPVPDLNDPTLILQGALHYATGCAACHGAPGQLASPIAQQMTPVPPALYGAWKDFDPSQLF